jgi:hypothetical protein
MKPVLLAAAVILLGVLLVSCEEGEEEGTPLVPQRPIEEVLQENADRLMAIDGVQGVGIAACNGRPCIRVFVIEKTPAVTARIPSRLDGYEVDVEETGEFRPR